MKFTIFPKYFQSCCEVLQVFQALITSHAPWPVVSHFLELLNYLLAVRHRWPFTLLSLFSGSDESSAFMRLPESFTVGTAS